MKSHPVPRRCTRTRPDLDWCVSHRSQSWSEEDECPQVAEANKTAVSSADARDGPQAVVSRHDSLRLACCTCTTWRVRHLRAIHGLVWSRIAYLTLPKFVDPSGLWGVSCFRMLAREAPVFVTASPSSRLQFPPICLGSV